MKRIFITAIALFALICSCEKTDPDLGEFQEYEVIIDMSQHNKFNEKSFYGIWTFNQLLSEQYVDGVLINSYTDSWTEHDIKFNSNHTAVKGDKKGTWLYSHNFLFMNINGSYNVYEVLECESDILSIRQEVMTTTGSSFFKDKSGEHHLYVFKYIPAR
jgi:hypothetical protein